MTQNTVTQKPSILTLSIQINSNSLFKVINIKYNHSLFYDMYSTLILNIVSNY